MTDYRLERLTFFDKTGVVIDTAKTIRAKDVLLFPNGSVLGSLMPGPHFLLWKQDRTLGPRMYTLGLDTAHNIFNPRGAIMRLGRGLDRYPLIAHERPGLWYSWKDLRQIRGVELLPSATYKSNDGFPLPPAATLAIGQMRDSTIVIVYRQYDLSSDPPVAYGTFLVAATPDGRPFGRAKLPPDMTAFSVSADRESLLAAFQTPWPHVVRYRMELSE